MGGECVTSNTTATPIYYRYIVCPAPVQPIQKAGVAAWRPYTTAGLGCNLVFSFFSQRDHNIYVSVIVFFLVSEVCLTRRTELITDFSNTFAR